MNRFILFLTLVLVILVSSCKQKKKKSPLKLTTTETCGSDTGTPSNGLVPTTANDGTTLIQAPFSCVPVSFEPWTQDYSLSYENGEVKYEQTEAGSNLYFYKGISNDEGTSGDTLYYVIFIDNFTLSPVGLNQSSDDHFEVFEYTYEIYFSENEYTPVVSLWSPQVDAPSSGTFTTSLPKGSLDMTFMNVVNNENETIPNESFQPSYSVTNTSTCNQLMSCTVPSNLYFTLQTSPSVYSTSDDDCGVKSSFVVDYNSTTAYTLLSVFTLNPDEVDNVTLQRAISWTVTEYSSVGINKCKMDGDASGGNNVNTPTYSLSEQTALQPIDACD